jgi:hypothetical protein
MKLTKHLFTTVIGMIAILQTGNAADHSSCISRSHPELERTLGYTQYNSGVDSMIYAKFDAYSTWIEKNIEENEIVPKIGFGFRYRNSRHGFDLAMSGQAPEKFYLPSKSDFSGEDKPAAKGTRSYTAGQLTYLYFTQPVSRNTFYFGAGAGIDRHSIKVDETHDYFGFLSGLFVAGYQFNLSDTMKSFLQFQASQPAYCYEKISTDIYGLTQVNQWVPTFSMSVGVGF